MPEADREKNNSSNESNYFTEYSIAHKIFQIAIIFFRKRFIRCGDEYIPLRPTLLLWALAKQRVRHMTLMERAKAAIGRISMTPHRPLGPTISFEPELIDPASLTHGSDKFPE